MLEDVRCFQRAEVPLGKQVTVIIGQNGSGKTTIAEALASLAYGEGAGWEELPIRSGARSGAVALEGGAAWPSARWDARGKESLGIGELFGYGQYRAVKPEALTELRMPPQTLADVKRRPATGTLFRFDDNLFGDLSLLAAMLHDAGMFDLAARAAWGGFASWLEKLDARIEGVVIEERGGQRRAMFRRLGTTLPIAELSDGYRAMLAVVLDLVVRYAVHFGDLLCPLEGRATVVIDEVDLNLHPRWQREIIKQLLHLFPETRFVLTTHSASVVQAAIDDHERCAVLVLKEEKEKGTTVRPLAAGRYDDLDGAEIDSLLVEVFGTPSRYSPTYEALEERTIALREKLENGTGTPAERRELLDGLDELHGLMAREERRKYSGVLMSAIAETQIGLLRKLDAQIKEGGPREPAPAKRRKTSR